MKNYERARAVVRYLAKKTGKNQYEIGQQIGYMNKQSFSMLLNGKISFPDTIPERLAALDPTINIDFLRGTSDRMLLGDVEQPLFFSIEPEEAKPASDPSPVPFGAYIPGEVLRLIDGLSADNRSLNETIRSLNETIRSQQETIRLLVSRQAPASEEGGPAPAASLTSATS